MERIWGMYKMYGLEGYVDADKDYDWLVFQYFNI